MALPIIANTSTFKAWLDQTNNTATILNANAVVAGVDAEGVFAVKKASGTSISLANGVVVNSSAVVIASNVTISANVSVAANAQAFTVASNTFVVSPAQGSRFDTATTVNAAFGILGVTTATANVGVTGDVSVTGNTALTGALSTTGPLTTRQIIFASSGAVVANTLGAATYDNMDANGAMGVATAALLNLTPSGNTAITGIIAPNNSVLGSTGARVLHIQNLSPTYYLSLYSANLSSTDTNRFQIAGDTTVNVPPSGALSLIYSKGTTRWRIIAPQITTSGATVLSDVDVTGNLSVTGATVLTANVDANPLYVDKTNSRVGIGKNNPAYQLETTANAYIGGWLIAPSANITALNSTGNVSFLSGAVTFTTSGNTLFVANAVTVNGTAATTIRNLSGNTITATQTLSTANLSASGHGSLATLAISGNTSFFGGAIVANTSGNTFYVANTVNVDGTPNSFIRTLRSATIFSDGSINALSLGVSSNASFANVTVSANASFANVSVSANISLANATFTAGVRASGTGARFVLPVGTNYYAT